MDEPKNTIEEQQPIRVADVIEAHAVDTDTVDEYGVGDFVDVFTRVVRVSPSSDEIISVGDGVHEYDDEVWKVEPDPDRPYMMILKLRVDDKWTRVDGPDDLMKYTNQEGYDQYRP